MLVPSTPGYREQDLERVGTSFGFAAETFSSFLDHDPDVPLRSVVIARNTGELKTGKQGVVVLDEKVLEVG